MDTTPDTAPDPLAPDGPYVDPLGANAPAVEGEPMLAEVGSPAHRAALEAIYGAGHDSWEAIELRARAFGVSEEDYAYGVREAHLAVVDASIQPEAPPEDYPHLDYRTEMPARPWSDEDWERDRLRAERAAAPNELGGGGVLTLTDLSRDTWRANVENGIDIVATLAREWRVAQLADAETHRARTLAWARENRQRQLDAERLRAEELKDTRELIEREERRRGKSTVRALQAMGQLPRVMR